MARDITGQPWKFDLTKQGEGFESKDSFLRLGTFTSTNGTNLINFTAHGFVTGEGPLRVEEGNTDLPSGLAESTDYWVIFSTANAFKFAASPTDAAAGTEVAIADDGTTPNYLLQKPNFPIPIYVKTILIESGSTGGTFEVHDKISGRTLTGALSLAANSHEQIVVAERIGGLYMTSMADGQILVYHGE